MDEWLLLRAGGGLTLKEAARLLGTRGLRVTPQTLRSWERGKTELPARAPHELRAALAESRATQD